MSRKASWAALAHYHRRAALILSDPEGDRDQKESCARHREWADMIVAHICDMAARAAATKDQEVNPCLMPTKSQ